MPLGLSPCATGVSELWRLDGVLLALGNACNAAAAAEGELLGVRVSHIVTVGSYRNHSAISSLLGGGVKHLYFRMSDWLRPDEELDLPGPKPSRAHMLHMDGSGGSSWPKRCRFASCSS